MGKKLKYLLPLIILAAGIMLANIVGPPDFRVAAAEDKLVPGDLVMTAKDMPTEVGRRLTYSLANPGGQPIGEYGLAFDLFQYVLLLDPENERAHKGLGHIKVKGEWLRRYRYDSESRSKRFGQG